MDWLIWAAVFGTSALSGVFGMAGGMLLLLLLTARLPLADAMVLHGSAQLVANGVRAALLGRHVRVELVARYVFAGVLAASVCALSAIVVDTRVALVITGLVGCAEPWLSRLRLPSIERPAGTYLCGALVSGLHVTSGATGPVLDSFFAHSSLPRHQNVATKALLQCCGHALKIIYFASLGAGGADLGLAHNFWPLAAAAVAGTYVGREILDHVNEQVFRKSTRYLVRGLGAVSLVRGALAFVP